MFTCYPKLKNAILSQISDSGKSIKGFKNDYALLLMGFVWRSSSGPGCRCTINTFSGFFEPSTSPSLGTRLNCPQSGGGDPSTNLENSFRFNMDLKSIPLASANGQGYDLLQRLLNRLEINPSSKGHSRLTCDEQHEFGLVGPVTVFDANGVLFLVHQVDLGDDEHDQVVVGPVVDHLVTAALGYLQVLLEELEGWRRVPLDEQVTACGLIW